MPCSMTCKLEDSAVATTAVNRLGDQECRFCTFLFVSIRKFGKSLSSDICVRKRLVVFDEEFGWGDNGVNP